MKSMLGSKYLFPKAIFDLQNHAESLLIFYFIYLLKQFMLQYLYKTINTSSALKIFLK